MAISVDEPADSKELKESLGLTIPLLSDPDMTVIHGFGVGMQAREIAVPTSFVVAKDGLVRWRYIGRTQADRPKPDAILAEALAAIDASARPAPRPDGADESPGSDEPGGDTSAPSP